MLWQPLTKRNSFLERAEVIIKLSRNTLVTLVRFINALYKVIIYKVIIYNAGMRDLLLCMCRATSSYTDCMT